MPPPPKPRIKKVKTQLLHIDELAVTMALSQLINIAALRHFRHMTTQKRVKLHAGFAI